MKKALGEHLRLCFSSSVPLGRPDGDDGKATSGSIFRIKKTEN
jgi:hypothetical protein